MKFKFIYGVWLLLSVCNITFAAGQNNTMYPNQLMMPQPQEIRDPFTPSFLMFDTVGQQVDAAGFMRLANEAVPKMRLIGFVNQDNNDPIALLGVAGSRTFLVREGDEININPAQPLSVIRITKINRQSITVETGRLGSIRVQR